MLQNEYLLAKIGADTAESEQHFAEILPIGRRVTGRVGSAQRYAESIASFQVGRNPGSAEQEAISAHAASDFIASET